MMYRRVPGWVVAAVLALVAVLSGWLGYLQEERLVFYAFAAIFLPAVWALSVLVSKSPAHRGSRPTDQLSGALALAGALLVVAFATRVASILGVVDEVFAERAVGVAVGCLLVVTGNAMPKILTPLERLRCDPAKVQSLERFAGWSLVAAGVFYALTWLVLAPHNASFWSIFVTAACVLAIAARFLLLLAHPRASRG